MIQLVLIISPRNARISHLIWNHTMLKWFAVWKRYIFKNESSEWLFGREQFPSKNCSLYTRSKIDANIDFSTNLCLNQHFYGQNRFISMKGVRGHAVLRLPSGGAVTHKVNEGGSWRFLVAVNIASILV